MIVDDGCEAIRLELPERIGRLPATASFPKSEPAHIQKVLANNDHHNVVTTAYRLRKRKPIAAPLTVVSLRQPHDLAVPCSAINRKRPKRAVTFAAMPSA
jgi:hypothetical protein